MALALFLGQAGVISEAFVQDVKAASENDGTVEKETQLDGSEEEILAEGYTESGDGFTSVVSWCKNGEYNIYGEFYYPENFDKNKTYPVVIMSHGGNVSHDFYEKAGWPSEVTKLGYVAYAFDFCGGSKMGHSDLTTMDMSVETEISDLSAVMDFVMDQSFCDRDQLYLMGQSFGGCVTGITAGRRNEDVAGVVLLYPALCVVDVLHEAYSSKEAIPEEGGTFFNAEVSLKYFEDMYDLDIMSELSAYKGDVLLIHGINDQTIPYTYSVEAISKAYTDSDSELVLIGGKKSVHAFELMYEEGWEYARKSVSAYLNSHIREEEKDEITYE